MEHQAQVAHHVRGRIRVRLPKAKRDRTTLESVKRAIAPMRGVKDVDINAATGSVVVHYDATEHDDFHTALARHAEEQNLFALGPPRCSEVDEIAETIEKEAEFLASRSETAKTIVDFFKAMNQQVKVATNNNLDLQVLLPLGLAAYSILEVGVEVSTPLWVTLGIFSFNSFLALHHPVPTTMEVEHEEVVTDPKGSRPTKSLRARRMIRKGGAQ